MDPQTLLSQVLFLFGIGFFAANMKVVADLLRFRLRKTSALLVWENPKPPYYGFALALGAILGVLVAVPGQQLLAAPGQADVFARG